MEHEFVKKDIDILHVMLSKIDGWYNGKVYISDLVYDLESLLNQLQTVDEEWKTDFRTSWLNIEVAFALALDEERDHLDMSGDKVVEESLIELRDLVLLMLKSLGSNG